MAEATPTRLAPKTLGATRRERLASRNFLLMESNEIGDFGDLRKVESPSGCDVLNITAPAPRGGGAGFEPQADHEHELSSLLGPGTHA